MNMGSYLCIIGQGEAKGKRALRRQLWREGWQQCGTVHAWAMIPCSEESARHIAGIAVANGVHCNFVPVSDEAYRGIIHA